MTSSDDVAAIVLVALPTVVLVAALTIAVLPPPRWHAPECGCYEPAPHFTPLLIRPTARCGRCGHTRTDLTA